MPHVLIGAIAVALLPGFTPAQLAAADKGSRAKDTRRLDDESLPEGALFRLGKYHFHHSGAIPFVYARDSKHLLTVSGWEKTMKTWDVISGRPLTERTLSEVAYVLAISPDGKLLAGGSSYNSMLYIWSAETGGAIAEIQKAGAWRVAFSADGGKVLDVGTAGVVQEIDIASKKVTRRTVLQKVPKNLPDNDTESGNMVFSRDGRTVAGFFADQTIHIWDVASGKELHRLKEPKTKTRLLKRPLAFSPDGKFLASVGPPLTVCIWEVAAGKKLRSFKMSSDYAAAMDRDDREHDLIQEHLIAYSPDGKYLAGWAEGDIKVWETATGKEAKNFPILSASLDCLSFSQDGKNVVGMSEGDIVVWDIARGRLLGYPDGKAEKHQRLTFLPDGRHAYTSSFRIRSARSHGQVPEAVQQTATWDIAAGKRLQVIPQSPLGHSPDGRYLLASAADESCGMLPTGTDPFGLPEFEVIENVDLKSGPHKRVGLVATQSGKVLNRFPSGDVIFCADGHKLAICSDAAVRIVECASGKRLRVHKIKKLPFFFYVWGSGDLTHFLLRDQKSLRLLDVAQGRQLWRRSLPPLGSPRWARVSADEKICVIVGDNQIQALDMGTGKELWRPSTASKWQARFRNQFSPDGKFLCAKCPKHVAVIDLASGHELYRIPWQDHKNLPWVGAFLGDNLLRVTAGDQVGLWRANGKLLRKLSYSGDPGNLAASPDGRLLAGPGEDGTISVWEIATGQVLRSFKAPEPVHTVTFSPDGRTLVSDDSRTTVSGGSPIIVVWDLTGLKLSAMDRPMPLTAADFGRCWADLAKVDGKLFQQAFWKLVADPDQTVSRLSGLLQPVRQAKSKTTEQLLRDLASDVFAVREQATRALEEDDSAVPFLYKRLQEKLSLEEKKRIEMILSKPLDLARRPLNLRLYRAVQLLEQIGTPAAIKLLRKLADATPRAMVTREARASLERVARRPPKSGT